MLVQDSLILSPYLGLYDIVVSEDNFLRKINELVNFEFIYDELKNNYCEDNGRPAECPIRMFKYLFLKTYDNLSDKDLVKRAYTDMAYKYFLNLAPEDDVIDSSTLTKFRKQRLKDPNLLNVLIAKTIQICIEKGIKLTPTLIADSTHTNSRFNKKSPREILSNEAKKLRKVIYEINEDMKKKFPTKPTDNTLESEIKYCQELIETVKKEAVLLVYPAIEERMNYLEELVNDDIEQLSLSKDTDATVGHKTADSAFYGFKTHLALTPERIITAAVVTTGEKHDGKQAETLIENSIKNGVGVEAFVGDGAYSEKDNILMAQGKEIKLVSKLSKTVTDGNKRKCDEFEYNKDAGRFVCPAGHMAIRVASMGKKKHKAEGTALRETHFFDVEKCKVCPLRDRCGYKDGQASKSYTVTLKKDSVHEAHEKLQETDEYKDLAKERYKVEAKNSEIKNVHGYDTSTYSGLFGMNLQAAITLFVANMKRIVTLIESK